MTKKDQNRDAKADRADRLKAALRANLRRRKQSKLEPQAEHKAELKNQETSVNGSDQN